ncbi:MAG TPA: HlyD family efflux transporter periplasmic adaptor subunit [Gemmatimonadales bacterium]|nr:HlyD family efflux transporter periplasmic adaptor subunit [Gemmatimonadales bacterium]
MKRWAIPAVVVAALAALAIALVIAYRHRHAQLAAQAAGEEAVVAPTRLKEVDGAAMVVLDRGDVSRLGLRTAVLRAATSAPVIRLAGELVPEPDRVTAVRAPIGGRLSLPAGARWPGFGDRLHAGSEIAQVSDAKPLVVPRGGVVTQLGAQPGEMVQAGQLLLEITDYGEPLARIAWPSDAPSPPPTVALRPGTGVGAPVRARLLGAAPTADPVTRLPAYLYRAERDWPGARPGAVVVAALAQSGAPRGGVVVPDRAVVQWEGLAWAYVQRGADRYARVRVPTDRPLAGGFLAAATGAFRPGDTVVVQGAEQLLSEEFRARVTVGDEPSE